MSINTKMFTDIYSYLDGICNVINADDTHFNITMIAPNGMQTKITTRDYVSFETSDRVAAFINESKCIYKGKITSNVEDYRFFYDQQELPNTIEYRDRNIMFGWRPGEPLLYSIAGEKIYSNQNQVKEKLFWHDYLNGFGITSVVIFILILLGAFIFSGNAGSVIAIGLIPLIISIFAVFRTIDLSHTIEYDDPHKASYPYLWWNFAKNIYKIPNKQSLDLLVKLSQALDKGSDKYRVFDGMWYYDNKTGSPFFKDNYIICILDTGEEEIYQTKTGTLTFPKTIDIELPYDITAIKWKEIKAQIPELTSCFIQGVDDI